MSKVEINYRNVLNIIESHKEEVYKLDTTFKQHSDLLGHIDWKDNKGDKVRAQIKQLVERQRRVSQVQKEQIEQIKQIVKKSIAYSEQ